MTDNQGSHSRRPRHFGGKGRGTYEPPRGRAAPVPVRDALDQLASTMGLASVDGINRLFLAWPEIVGEELASQCSAKRLTDGVLTVEAVDQQWATELQWMTQLIADRCCDALGEGAVTDVKIVRPTNR